MQCFAFARSGCNEGGWTSPANAGAQNSVWTRGEGGSRNKTSPGLQLIWTLIYHRIQASGCLWSTIGIRDPCKDRAKNYVCICIAYVLCFANCQITWYGIATEARTKRHFSIYVQNVVTTVLLNLKSSYWSWKCRKRRKVCFSDVAPTVTLQIKLSSARSLPSLHNPSEAKHCKWDQDNRHPAGFQNFENATYIIIIIHSLHLQDKSKWI